MEPDPVFILQMEADIRHHSEQVAFWNMRLSCWYQRKRGKRYSEASKELYHGLIQFYGATEGKRIWASHLRKRKVEFDQIRQTAKHHRAECTRLKKALALYRK